MQFEEEESMPYWERGVQAILRCTTEKAVNNVHFFSRFKTLTHTMIFWAICDISRPTTSNSMVSFEQGSCFCCFQLLPLAQIDCTNRHSLRPLPTSTNRELIWRPHPSGLLQLPPPPSRRNGQTHQGPHRSGTPNHGDGRPLPPPSSAASSLLQPRLPPAPKLPQPPTPARATRT